MTIEYNEDIPLYGHIMTVGEFKDICRCGGFIDYDGFGRPIRNSKMSMNIRVYPSALHLIPEDATYIIWFNK